LDEKIPGLPFFSYILGTLFRFAPPRSRERRRERPGTETDDEDHAFRDFAIERDEILLRRGKNSTREWIIIIGCVM